MAEAQKQGTFHPQFCRKGSPVCNFDPHMATTFHWEPPQKWLDVNPTASDVQRVQEVNHLPRRAFPKKKRALSGTKGVALFLVLRPRPPPLSGKSVLRGGHQKDRPPPFSGILVLTGHQKDTRKACAIFGGPNPNVNPGLINPWLIKKGVSAFGGDSSLLEGCSPPQKMGRVY